MNKVKSEKRVPGYFLLSIYKGDKLIFEKRLSKEDFYKVYFKNLEENIKNHPEFDSEQLLLSYKNIWTKFTMDSSYIDSYGHYWKNTLPSDNMFLKYLKGKIHEITNK